MTDDVIRFNRPALEGNELAYIQTAVETGHTSCSGPYATAASGLLQDWFGAADVLLTTSCTAALEMSALLLDLTAGRHRRRPVVHVPVDRARVRPHRCRACCSATSSARRSGSTPRTSTTLLDDPTVRAVVPVHYAGVGCDIAGIVGAIGRSRHRDRRGQRARPVRLVPRPPARQPRPLRDAQLPRDEELHLRRGRRAGRERRPRRRPRPRALRQGHEPPRVHARRGRQVLVAGHRLVVRPERGARRVPLRTARAARHHPRQAARGDRAVPRRARADRRRIRRACCRPCRPTATRRTTCSTCCSPTRRYPRRGARRRCAAHGRAADVPLRAAAQLARRATSSRRGRPECPVTDDISRRLLRLPFHNNLSTGDIERVVGVFRDSLVAAGAKHAELTA